MAYRPADLDALSEEVRAARDRDGERLALVERLSRRGQLVREGGLLRAHREVWRKEQARLETEKQLVKWDTLY